MRRFGSLALTLCAGAIVGVSIFIVLRQDDVVDWWILRGYDPPAAIEQLAIDTTMTDLGQRYFYVYQPELLGRDMFRQRCTVAEKSIVLGCYVTRQGIYIFDVTDEQLTGIRQVTAAHEMLHVAYERLSADEQRRIDRLNLEVFDQLEDERVKRTIDAYRQRDPAIVANELHSILPTEVRELTPELEAYYAQYFEDRLQVVAFAEQYADVFESARDRVDSLDQQLRDKRQEIDSLEANLDTQAAVLEQDRSRLNQLLADDDITAYNNGVDAFNRNVNIYNTLVNQLQELIDRYNALVAERNQAIVAYESLTESIDSGPPPIDPL